MEITFTYRPLTTSLSVWNTIDDILSEDERQEIKTTHEFGMGEDDEWHYSVSTYNGYFHEFTVIGIQENPDAWLWLAHYISDEVVAYISEMVTKWDLDYQEVSDQRERVLTRHKVTLNL
jgi:hypothetical protein